MLWNLNLLCTTLSPVVSDHTLSFILHLHSLSGVQYKRKKSCPKARLGVELPSTAAIAQLVNLPWEGSGVVLIMEPFIPRENSCLTLQCTQTKHLLQPEKPVSTETGYGLDISLLSLLKCYNTFFSIVVILKNCAVLFIEPFFSSLFERC